MVFFHGYPDISKASSFNLRPFDLVKINIPDLHSLSSEGWKKNHLKFYYSFQEMNFKKISSLNNLTGLNDPDSIISSNKLLSLTLPSTLVPKLPILVSQCGLDLQTSTGS